MTWLTDYTHYSGNVASGMVDLTCAIPIGDHLKLGRYLAYRGWFGPLREIGVVTVNDYLFIVDGRHRARASFDDHRLVVPAQIKVSDSKDLEHFLFGLSYFFLDEIPLLAFEKK